MAAGETTYCDDFEAITGQKIPAVETKVITAPAPVETTPPTTAEVA